ncbi:MAG: antibiotic biosynthesis monooxygenase [Nocardioides sp.]|jgi:quinol monooxygenase YgiN|nr:antibiotic biosynthesis monooxygenase [Nocardioides sp.]
MSLHVVAHFHAAPGRGPELRALLAPLVAPTSTEDGCLTYRLHEDGSDPDHLVFIEEWRDAASLEVHMQTPHVAGMLADVPPLLARPVAAYRLAEI